MRKLVAFCLKAKATARIRQHGTSHIARSSGAAAGRVSNDEALPAVCGSHVQQSQQLEGGWSITLACLSCSACPPACLDGLHRSVSRPPDGHVWKVAADTITEVEPSATLFWKRARSTCTARPRPAQQAQHIEHSVPGWATFPVTAWQIEFVAGRDEGTRQMLGTFDK